MENMTASDIVELDPLLSVETLQRRKFELINDINSNFKLFRTLAWDFQTRMNAFSQKIDGKVLPVNEHLNKLFDDFPELLLLEETSNGIPETINVTNFTEGQNFACWVDDNTDSQDDFAKEQNSPAENTNVNCEKTCTLVKKCHKKSKKLTGWLFQRRRKFKTRKSSLKNNKKRKRCRIARNKSNCLTDTVSDKTLVASEEAVDYSNPPNESFDTLLVSVDDKTIAMIVDSINIYVEAPTMESNSAIVKKKRNGVRIVCSVCKKMVNIEYIKNHMKFVHSSIERGNCPICFASLRPTAFFKHVKRVHPSVKKLPCVTCGKGFGLSTYVSKHLFGVHENC